MKHSFIALLSALLVLSFTPTAEAKDKHRSRKHHRGHDRERYSSHHHDRGHHYGHYRRSHSVYRAGHYGWVNHHRVWISPRTVVVYY